MWLVKTFLVVIIFNISWFLGSCYLCEFGIVGWVSRVCCCQTDLVWGALWKFPFMTIFQQQEGCLIKILKPMSTKFLTFLGVSLWIIPWPYDQCFFLWGGGIFHHLVTKKRPAATWGGFFGRTSPKFAMFWGKKKKRLKWPYLNHTFLHAASKWKVFLIFYFLPWSVAKFG